VDVTFSHVGICVSDLERSVRFYCEGLGFELVQSHTVGEEFGRLMELDHVVLQSRFVRRDGVSIELLHFDSPGHSGEAVRRPMNQLGLTHLSLRVQDVDVVAEAIESRGGTVVADTRTTFGSSDVLDFVYCTDPDGVRIELMHLPG
jgi:catechol 2,3-dioxygenase-like lactoylglutathione lyase family enzyme